MIKKKMSGGTRQRLALAVQSLPAAPVLVLDEPGLSLDPDWRRFLHGELHGAARRGVTVLVATHLLGEWEGQADRCLVLEEGRVARELPPSRLRDAFPFALPSAVRARAFFFQAEDGIRDIGVTGVQTCALPISASSVLFRDQRQGYPYPMLELF